MHRRLRFAILLSAMAAGPVCRSQMPTPRVIELTAGADSRYRQGKKAAPTLQVLAGEALILRITAVQAKEMGRDGSVHGLALLDKNSKAVPGWRFFFHPGVQDVAVNAPLEPGRYTAVCTVICSDGHEGMGFTLDVVPPAAAAKE